VADVGPQHAPKAISESGIRYSHFRLGARAETSWNAPAAISESPGARLRPVFDLGEQRGLNPYTAMRDLLFVRLSFPDERA
jgi:hypothetical protein